MKRFIKIFAYVIYYMFARHLPISYQPYAFGSKYIRYACCKKLLAKCGRQANIEHGADFGVGSSVELGNYSGIGIHARIGDVKIGDYVMMGPDVCIFSHNHQNNDLNTPMSFQGFTATKPVVIENNVWIGARVIILPGVTIGEGSIIGANAVVTKDVPSFAVVAGNPARIVRMRTYRITGTNKQGVPAGY